MSVKIYVQDTVPEINKKCMDLCLFIKKNLDLYEKFMRIDIVKVTKENVTQLKRLGLKRIPTLMFNNNIIEGVDSIKGFLVEMGNQFLKKQENPNYNPGQNDRRQRERQPTSGNGSSDTFGDFLLDEAVRGSKVNSKGRIEGFNDDDNDSAIDGESTIDFNKKMREMEKVRKSKFGDDSRNPHPTKTQFKETKQALQSNRNRKMTEDDYDNEFESGLLEDDNTDDGSDLLSGYQTSSIKYNPNTNSNSNF